MPTKPWYSSKTLWFNVLALIVAVATAFGYGQTQPDANIDQYALVIVTIINVILRLVTNKGLTS